MGSPTSAAQTSSPTAPTTASPTNDNDGSDSGSEDDSSDTDLFSAFSSMFAAKQDDDVNNLDATLDDGSAQQMKISLNDSTLMNLWLMIGLCLVGNAIAFYLCRGKATKQQSFEESSV